MAATPDLGSLLGDPVCALTGPVLCFHHWALAAERGGAAWLPWRADHLQAQGRVRLIADPTTLPGDQWDEATLCLVKHRQAALGDAACLWRSLRPGGRLLVAGANAVGVKTTVRHIAAWCGVAGETVLNRARARVVAFVRDAAAPPAPSGTRAVALSADPDAPLLASCPGVFSAEGLDPGTALLQEYLRCEAPARRVVDIGAGIGHLGLFCARLWSAAQVLLLEADARALAMARHNSAQLALADRVRCRWWDVQEDLGDERADLVVCNPPCHRASSTTRDLGVAAQMLTQARALLDPGGRLLVVANRQLPYEGALARLFDPWDKIAENGVYKVLRACR